MKRALILLVCFAAITITAKAQITIFEEFRREPSVKIAGPKELVTEAVKDNFVLIRQQYRLKRQGDYFGKDNMPFFGETYTLGVKVSGGMLMQNRVVLPWLWDSDYKRINEDGKYEPTMFWSYQKNLNDSVFKTTDLELGTKYVYPVSSDSLVFLHESSHAGFGLQTDMTEGTKRGYMVWAYAATNVHDSTMTVQLRQSEYTVTANSDSAVVKITPDDADRLLGGVLVVPRFEAKGRVQFLLAGVAAKTMDGQWKLQLLTQKSETGTAEPVYEEAPEPNVTPISKPSRKRKK